MVLSGNNIKSASKSLSISQILSLMKESSRKAYSTTYRHLCNMTQQGYVECGLFDERFMKLSQEEQQSANVIWKKRYNTEMPYRYLKSNK